MTGLPENVEQLLTELVERSRHEMNIILALADAIRRTDEQMLREVQSVTRTHEARREAIRDELESLARQLCVLPQRSLANGARTTIESKAAISAPDEGTERTGGSWRDAARKIDDDIEEAFGSALPRH